MKSRQGSVLETERRIQGFLDTNTGILGTLNSSNARTELDDSVVQLTAHALNQDAGLVSAMGQTLRQQALRTALRVNNMKPITAIARAKLRDVPEFGALVLPKARSSTSRLVAAAGAMAEAAGKHLQVFIDEGLAPDFTAQLLAAADAVKGTIDVRATGRGRRKGATTGLDAEEQRARRIIHVLDTLVVSALGTNDALLGEWKSLKHINKKPGVPTGTTKTPPATTPPATTAPATTALATTALATASSSTPEVPQAA